MGSILKLVLLIGFFAIPILANPFFEEKEALNKFYNDDAKNDCDACKKECKDKQSGTTPATPTTTAAPTEPPGGFHDKVAKSSATKVTDSPGTENTGSVGTENTGSAGAENTGSAGAEGTGSAGAEGTGSAGTEGTGSTDTEGNGSTGGEDTGSAGAEVTGSAGAEGAVSDDDPAAGGRFKRGADDECEKECADKCTTSYGVKSNIPSYACILSTVSILVVNTIL